MDENYEEVTTEYEDTELTGSDFLFITGFVLLACIVLALGMTLIRKTFMNIHLKIGNKIELGVETKDDKNVSKRS